MALLAKIPILWSPLTIITAEQSRAEHRWSTHEAPAHLHGCCWRAAAFTFSIAVGVNRVVGEADLVAFPCCIDNKVCQAKKRLTFTVHLSLVSLVGVCVCVCVTIVEVKQEAAHVFVVNLPPAISFILRDDLENQDNDGETEGTNQRRACGGGRTSPQYSEMKSFFCTGSLMKMPHPATSDGASSRC